MRRREGGDFPPFLPPSNSLAQWRVMRGGPDWSTMGAHLMECRAMQIRLHTPEWVCCYDNNIAVVIVTVTVSMSSSPLQFSASECRHWRLLLWSSFLQLGVTMATVALFYSKSKLLNCPLVLCSLWVLAWWFRSSSWTSWSNQTDKNDGQSFQNKTQVVIKQNYSSKVQFVG